VKGDGDLARRLSEEAITLDTEHAPAHQWHLPKSLFDTRHTAALAVVLTGDVEAAGDPLHGGACDCQPARSVRASVHRRSNRARSLWPDGRRMSIGRSHSSARVRRTAHRGSVRKRWMLMEATSTYSITPAKSWEGALPSSTLTADSCPIRRRLSSP
jgi:hypothetical protein